MSDKLTKEQIERERQHHCECSPETGMAPCMHCVLCDMALSPGQAASAGSGIEIPTGECPPETIGYVKSAPSSSREADRGEPEVWFCVTEGPSHADFMLAADLFEQRATTLQALDRSSKFDTRIEMDKRRAKAFRSMRTALRTPAETTEYVKVPREPTREMLNAAVEALMSEAPHGGMTRISGPSKVWKAMLAAAPSTKD